MAGGGHTIGPLGDLKDIGCQVSRAASNSRFTGRWRSPTSAITNTRRSSICCSRCSTIRTPPPSCGPATSISTSCAATLTAYLEAELDNLVTDGGEDSKPTAGFQRVIQRAVIHVQSSGREEVTGANVLVAIFAERESHAAYFLQEQDMTRYDAVNYISHGIAKRPGLSESRRRARRRRGYRRQGPATSRRRRATRSTPIASTSTRRRKDGKIDPLIGRDAEINRTIQVLCRRQKNNPLFVGDPGVGKTAIAEGLARAHRARRGAGGAARTRPCSRSTWARCSPAPAIAAISRSASSR